MEAISEKVMLTIKTWFSLLPPSASQPRRHRQKTKRGFQGQVPAACPTGVGCSLCLSLERALIGELLFQIFWDFNKQGREVALLSPPWFSIWSQTHLVVSNLLHIHGKQASQSQALHSHSIYKTYHLSVRQEAQLEKASSVRSARKHLLVLAVKIILY